MSAFSEAGDAQAPDVEVGAVTGSVGPPSGPIVQPPGTIAPTGVSGCTDGTYVNNPRRNTGLVSDCQALIAISKHWTGRSGNVGLPGRHPLRTWGAGNSRIGSWAGVSVSNRRVVGLDLHVGRNAAASRISGPLPTQLGDLTSLRHLNLSGNKLKGSIPEELGDLTDLKQLYLDGNNLTGSIPEELGDLSDLKQLHLSGNKLAGSIPEELGDLTSLNHLSLSGNKLTGSIPEELGDLSSLNQLHLGGNGLTGSIPEELGDLTSLSQLSLNGNGLTGSIPEELGDLTSLKHLYLNGNELTGSIPEELGDISSLKHLHLSDNGLTGSIPEELGDITGLTHLYLNDNNLTGSIPEELGDLSSLKQLHLSDNGLTGPIPEELGDITGLTHLYLEGNELRGLVPQELGDITGLKQLHLSGNQLSGSVPDDLGDLSPSQGGSLARLFICRNMLSVTLPADLRSVEGDASTCAPAPAGLEATAGDGQVTLNWSDPGNRDIRGYQYRVCEPGGVSCGAWADIPGSGASTASYVAEDLENDRDYLFQLRGENGSGPGMSAEVAARPGLPKPPTAEAGDDQTVEEGATVTLDGSGSGDPEIIKEEALTYLWTQTGGTAVTLSSSTAQSPTFTAPEQLIENAILVFSLVVTDAGSLASSPDTVTVTVTAGPNDPPVADAGDDQTVEEGATVTLDGSGSSDPEGEALTYLWEQTGGTAVTLSNVYTAAAGFTAPAQLLSDATLVFRLTVFSPIATDARSLPSSEDTVTVTVTAGSNDAPVADAGDDQTVEEGATVTLDGSGSSDPEEEALTYLWTQTGGPTVTLSSSTAQSPTFTAPGQLVKNATLVFSLVVTDARGLASSADTVTVTVTGRNDFPVADAGDDQTVGEGATVTLDGSGSSDPEEEALTYLWTQIGEPAVSLSSRAAQMPTFTAPDQLVNNVTLVFFLEAVDPHQYASSADRVTVTVTAGPNDAPTADAGDDRAVAKGATVTLDGSDSSDPEEEALTYRWTQTGGTTVTLSSSTARMPTFTVPQQVANPTLVFSLVVTDARGLASSADTVTITVNDPPTADAGDDQTVGEGATVTLDGSGSSDPEEGTLTYAWTQSSGTTVTLSSSTAESPTFTAPTLLAENATLVFSLVVTDPHRHASSADTVTVTVKVNNAPTAEAGNNRNAVRGSSVTLDGSGSSDPDNDTLKYSWRQTSGTTTVTLSNANAAKASFTAPSTLGEYGFELTVSDRTRSATDSVVITVIAPPIYVPPRDPVITPNTDTFYRRGTSLPSAPTANTGTPSGWSTTDPGPTSTEGVYSVVRTQTLRDGVVISASYGSVSKISDPRSDDDDTATQTFYRRGTSLPSAPTANTGTPSGWSTTDPGPTSTEGVYSVVRTQTLRDGVVISASYGSVIKISSPDETATQTFYRRGTSTPSAPTANTGTPSGWSTTNPGPTDTEGVYSVTRTQTLRNNVVISASYDSILQYVCRNVWVGYDRRPNPNWDPNNPFSGANPPYIYFSVYERRCQWE